MNDLKLVSWVICLHLLLAINAYGNIYKCIESDGTLKFQDYPCTNQENQKTEILHQSTKTNHGENTKSETKSNQINFLEKASSGDFADVRISPFKAKYYTENDGKNVGKGNDGSLKGIEAKLKFTESVKRPSLNLTFPFHGIDSYNLYGVWEGIMTVTGEKRSVNAQFDVSWGDVSFYVNDQLMAKWNNEPKIVQFNLNKGENKIRIELHNHWHTTSFNASFTNYQKLDKSDAEKFFKTIDFSSTKVVYLGAYEAGAHKKGDNYNEITVTIPGSTDPVFIFLNSFRAVNWVIKNPQNTKIVGIAIRGRSPASTVENVDSTPVYELPDSKNAYKSSFSVSAFTGKNADYVFSKYSLNDIIVPDFFQAKADNSPKRNVSIGTKDSSSQSQAERVPVNSFIESLTVQEQNNAVTKTQVVKEPALDGTFIKSTWKGHVDVSKETDKTFKISHQGIKVELIIDGRSVWRGGSYGEQYYQYTFRPGRHEVMFVAYPKIESKSAKLTVSITDNAKNLKYDELAMHLKKLGDFDSIFCGVEEGKSSDKTVDIILKNPEKPVVLFLTSYKRAIWDFKNCSTGKIAAIVTSAKNASEHIKNLPSDIPVYHFFSLANTTRFIPNGGKRLNIKNTFKSAALQILALTGNLPSGFCGAKQTDTILVPEIVLDREKYQHIGFSDISPGYNVFIEYPSKIDVVFNPVITKYIDPKSSSKFKRSKKILPEVQRKSWAEPLGATKDIPTGAFRAYYFDIFNSGQPKFIGIVEDVSVSGSGRTHDIIPDNFGAFWIGNILVDKDKEMELNFDKGHAETRILIDDKVVTGGRVSLKKGLHKVEIEYVNDWHTYDFSFSLTEPQPLLAYEALKEQLGAALPKRVHTAYVGVYDSNSSDKSIKLDIKNVGRPIFLILASSHAVNWVIEGPGAKDVAALLISSNRAKSKIKGNINKEVRRFFFPMWQITYKLESQCECSTGYYCSSKDLFDTMDYISTITGRKINSFAGNYDAESFVIPEIIIDRKQFKALKRVAKENLMAQSRCEGPEYTPQTFDKKQRKQIGNHPSVIDALKIMELIRDNKLDDCVQLMGPSIRKYSPDELKEYLLFQHNRFAGYDPSIAYHRIDRKMYAEIIANKEKLTIPLVWRRKNIKDKYIKVRMNKVGDRWLFYRIR